LATQRFRVVTDSTADLPPAWRAQYGIEVVPLNVIFDSQSFRDGVDIQADEFFRKLGQAKKLPTTSAPAPGDFAAVYERLSHECDGCISIHIGGNLSGTAEAARVGAQSVDGFRVEVIDSRSVSMTIAFLCQVAATAPDFESALAAVQQRLAKQRVLALLDTLKYVEMGGRVGRIQYIVGSMLDMKAILGLADGEIKALDRVRTRAKAIPRLVERLRADSPIEKLAIMHSQAPQEAERVRDEVASEFTSIDIEVGQIGAVLGTHAGPNALGACYLKA
jgi:DegV family protein with EDD domain